MDIAYSKRDLKSIKKRARINFLYRAFRKTFKVLVKYNNKQVRSMLYYPCIENESELKDIINRVFWAFPYKEDLVIYLPVNNMLENINVKYPQVQNSRTFCPSELKHVRCVPKEEIPKYLNSDIIFVHKSRRLLDLSILVRLYKTKIIDRNYFASTESNIYQEYYRTFSNLEKDEFIKLSKYNYSKLLDEAKGFEEAYCFATGPSFEKAIGYKYPDNSFKVICNSIVKNKMFLEHIKKPHLLTFSDPVFHYGPSEYARQFRDQVVDVVKKYDCFVMVPFKSMAVLLAHYPVLRKKIIGMPSGANKINFPTTNNFKVKSSENILTGLMLPVASSLSKNIYIIGADGRQKDEEYFWKHSPLVQYHDLMQTAIDMHPSFFRDRIYEDYYEKHCQFLKMLIKYGESLGKKYYSLTPSYIPVLTERYNKKERLI